jgi:hypothetical protein
MGLFKSLKDVKELGADHGGMPSLREAFKDVGAVADDHGERAILKNGTPAKAVVKGFTSKFPGDRFSMQVPLEIYPPSGEPYEVIYVFPAPRMQAPLSAGMEVPVKISPDDPQRVAVQWDALKAAVAAAGGTMAAVQAGLSEASGGRIGAAIPADGVMRMPDLDSLPDPGAFAAATQDPQARLAKLDELKKAGLIDDAEYGSKRQQIIDAL